MDLQPIKTLCEKRPGGIRGLASAIKMTEQNLHRCIRENKIQAQDLELIAKELGKPIGYFFDEEVTVRKSNSVRTSGANSPATVSGDIAQTVGGADPVLLERIRGLEALVEAQRETIDALKAPGNA